MSALDIFIAIIAIPTIFYIPGLVAFRAFNVHKIRRLRLSAFESIFLQILASIVITGWVALVLAEAGCFSLWLLIVIVELGSFFIFVIFRRKFGLPKLYRPRFNLNIHSILLIILIIVAGSLFLRPSEEIIGRHDIGIYISTGVNIANTGAIVTHDPIIESMPDHLRSNFYSISENPTSYREGSQFPDFVIEDKETGTIVPWRLPLHQIWFAVFYSIFGLEGALYSQPLFALFSILTIFLLCKTIWNWKVGTIAAALISVNFVQVFFTQYTSPEILFQLLSFSGIFSFILFLRTRNGFLGALSAICFGQLMVTRLDAVLVFIPLIFVIFYVIFLKGMGKSFLYFLIPFFVIWFHSLLHINYFCMAFIDETIINIQTAQGLSITLASVQTAVFAISIAVALVAFSGVLCSGRISRLSAAREKTLKHIYKPRFLMLIVLLLIGYLILTSPNKELASWVENLVIFPRDFDTMVALSWFIGWFGLVLALVGLVFMIFHKPSTESYIFLGIVSLSVFAFLLTLANNPVFPWGMRRTVPILLPAIMIFIGYCLDKFRDLMVRRYHNKSLITNSIMVLLICALLLPSISMCRTLMKPQFDNYIQQVSNVAAFFPNESIIIDYSYATDLTLSMPLKYIYGKNAIYLRHVPENAYDWSEMVNIWNSEGKEVYLIVYPTQRFNSLSNSLSGIIDFTHEASFQMHVTKVAWETRTFSNLRTENDNILEVYRLDLLYSQN